MANTDIMIDLETLATSPDAAILTIGAVKFDPFGDDIKDPKCEKFYVRVDLDSCDRIGLVTTDDTIAWWANQSKEAQDEAFGEDNRVDIVDAFNDEVAGWYFDIEFKSIFEWDACSLPITGSPAVINPDDVRIIDQDGNIIAVVPCGSYYTIEVLQELIQTLTNPAPVTIIQTLT